MRFRFCGDLDCPDWVLAEISTLAKISSVKLRLLCSQVLKELLGQGIDYEKILKLTADARFESGDVKATVAVLNFILSSAAKHSVDGESLSSELQQLGLPKAPTFTLPQSTRPACVAVMRRSKALCRSICEPAACAVRVARACAVRVVRVARTRGNLGSVLQGNVDGEHLSSEVTHDHTPQSRACGLQLGFFPLGSAVDNLSSQLMSTCPGSEVKGRRASKGHTAWKA
nr:PREDICTED: COMM domain-containing protein 4 isoform X2 [Rhinolophus sinicus]